VTGRTAPTIATPTTAADATDRRHFRHTLANGLRVVVEEDRRLPLVAVNLRYDVGSRDERPGLTGFAHLFEHVMFEGSAGVKAGEHFELLQAAGATLNATTSFDRTTYYETIPTSHLELALWLEADRMGSLDLTAETFDNQREVVKNEKRQRYDNQPYGDTIQHLHAAAYPDRHPYRHLPIGSMADLDAASLEDARSFHRDWYGPNNCVLSIVGDLDADHATALVERYFGGIPGHPHVPDRRAPHLPPALDEPVRAEVHADVPAPQLTIGIRVPRNHEDRGHDAVDVLARALGSGRGSRLFRALVVDRQLIQPEHAIVRCEHLHAHATLLVLKVRARSGVDVADIEAAIESVLAEVAAAGITPDELRRVQVTGLRGFHASMATVTARADRYGKAVTEHDHLIHAFDTPARLEDLSLQDVAEAASRWLKPENRAIVTHLPSSEAHAWEVNTSA